MNRKTIQETPAFKLLHQDHARFEELFKELEQESRSREEKEIFEELKQELLAHSEMEIEVLYPACQRHDELQELVEESLDNHQEVESELDEISKTQDYQDVDDRIDELINDMRDHMKLEEGELFPKMMDIMSQNELDQIHRGLEDFKARNEPTGQMAA